MDQEAKENELQKMMKEMDNALKIVQDSDVIEVKNNQAKSRIKHLVGTDGSLQLVIFGLDNIQSSFRSKLHLALALSLRDQADLGITEIVVYATLLNELEVEALNALGCNPLPYDYLMTSGFDKPTLLFMPSPISLDTLGELLLKNWHPSQLRKMMVLGVSLKEEANKSLQRICTKYSMGDADDCYPRPLPWIGEKRLCALFQMLKSRPAHVSTGDLYEYAAASGNFCKGYETRMSYVCKIWKHVIELKLVQSSSKDVKAFLGFSWQFFDPTHITVQPQLNTLLELPVPSTPAHPSSGDDWFNTVNDTRYPQLNKRELKLWREMKFAIAQLKASEFYLSLRNRLLLHDAGLQTEIMSRIGNEDQVQMVIYGLGRLESNGCSRLQLALALLLREDVNLFKLGEILIYDPAITRIDAGVIRLLGCTVLTVNEFGRRKIQKPMVFFTPFLPYDILDNMLEANWSPVRLNKVVWLTSSFERWSEELTEGIMHITAIKNYSKQFAISDVNSWGAFAGLRWHVFSIEPDVDLRSLLRGNGRESRKKNVANMHAWEVHDKEPEIELTL